MLQRLYVDNYKSLVNFDLQFGALNLLLGDNGSGKTTVFEVLNKLHLLLVAAKLVYRVFPSTSLTKWLKSSTQQFELSIKSGLGSYRYILQVEHDKTNRQAFIQHESLYLDQQVLVEFASGSVKLYSDDAAIIAEYPADSSRSIVATIPPRRNTTKLTAFQEQMATLIIVHPITIDWIMSSESAEEGHQPSLNLENFVSWYRYLIQDGNFYYHLVNDLKKVIRNFRSLSLTVVGEDRRLLIVDFQDEKSGTTASFRFDELSDGQRMLIVLYTLLHLPDHADSRSHRFMVCIDEPENFIGLREIQPWLASMLERVQDNDLQLILISHHPESINYLLMPDETHVGLWFSREHTLAPTRVEPVRIPAEELPVSELIARGWLENAR
ncbi:MAG: AAA family ATPase [bacterium]|nr:AAA family ATPase [bacterium]